MSDDQTAIDWSLLDKRIEELEYLVYKAKDGKVAERRRFKSVADGIYIVQDRLNRSRSGKTNIKHVWQQLEFLHKIISSEFFDELTVTDDVKREIILASETYFRDISEHLEEIKSLEEFINSDIWKNVPDQIEKFRALQEIFAKQQDETEHLSEQVQELLINYNSAVSKQQITNSS
ncbi:Dynactin subunit 3 [Trichoplax sp. H2]|nr:Dynactin subunit 3 [Trichoplax sp. H2]|eukprot:RDD43493.1 Dynactin subunit 3 [Trichoplax sp. H2]